MAALISTIALMLHWKLESLFHNQRIRSKTLRIHVNGIRGKSTVTRIVAGMLRQAGYNTFAKTTGSAACIIDTAGTDHAILRTGSPTILEQVKIIREIEPAVEALVIECMAINPKYQSVCELKIIQSNIGVITNVREDHQEVLGKSLPEIAYSLLTTCPINGTLITAEQNPQLLPIFQQVAEEKHTKLIFADPNEVNDEELNSFNYVAFKENIAIGLAIAKILGIDREMALAGMISAAADPGALLVSRTTYKQCQLTWADMFAVNDRESVIAAVNRVASICNEKVAKIALLNNRTDREYRAIQFAQIAANDLKLDYVALLGAYERQVESELIRCGFPRQRIIKLGEHRGYIAEELVDRIVDSVEVPELLMMGMVNIHTTQAESIRKFFNNRDEGQSP